MNYFAKISDLMMKVVHNCWLVRPRLWTFLWNFTIRWTCLDTVEQKTPIQNTYSRSIYFLFHHQWICFTFNFLTPFVFVQYILIEHLILLFIRKIARISFECYLSTRTRYLRAGRMPSLQNAPGGRWAYKIPARLV